MRRIIFILAIIGVGLLILDYIGYYVVAAFTGPNLHDVNEFFGVSINRVDVWTARGGGPRFFKVGSSVRYRLSDLREFAEKSLREPA